MQWATNVFGHFVFMAECMDLLKKSTHRRRYQLYAVFCQAPQFKLCRTRFGTFVSKSRVRAGLEAKFSTIARNKNKRVARMRALVCLIVGR